MKHHAPICIAVSGVLVFGVARAQVAPLPTGPGVLSWQIQQVTDKMTDVITSKAVSGGIFDDGISLEASASCDKLGADFAFDTFRNREAVAFAWRENKIGLRVRVNGGEVRTAQAEAEYNNEAKVIFYDPSAAQKIIQAALPKGQERDNYLLDMFNGVTGEATLNQIAAVSAGKLKELLSAGSVRVELDLANGRAYVVDLNPQDQVLHGLIQQCDASLQAPVQTHR